MSNTAVFGLYDTQFDVEIAIQRLTDTGFRSADISVLLPKNAGSKDLAIERNSKAPEGTAAGATSGAVIGGTLGLLVGIGALAIPGLGPLIAAGPIVAALTGIGAGGVVGGLTGSLIGLGVPEYEAKRFEGRVRSGAILLSIHADDSEWAKKAKQILEATGAQDIATTPESKGDYANSERPVSRIG